MKFLTLILAHLLTLLAFSTATPTPGRPVGRPRPVPAPVPGPAPPAPAPAPAPPAPAPAPGRNNIIATILFDIDGNEAIANFQVAVPGARAVNQQLLALAIANVQGLAPGQDEDDVVCQAFDVRGRPLGGPFSGDDREVVDGFVGAIACDLFVGFGN
ncbi:hypothetical protein OQA88_7405 [Cercophora sp. LCS_1]